MDVNNIFKDEFYYKNMFNLNPKKSNNNLRKIKLAEKRLSFIQKRSINNTLSSPNLLNNNDYLSYNYTKDMQNKIKVNSKNNKITKKASIINQNYLKLNNNYNYLKKDINNNAFNNINSFIKKNNYINNNSSINNTYTSQQIKDINSENLKNKLKKPSIGSYKDIKSIKYDLNDEDSNLSDIADEIIKISQKGKKITKKSNSSKNNTKVPNKKKIFSKLYKGKTPQNYTFKTLFVNNFCIVPMNSSFIGRNDTNKELKKINYSSNMILNRNINNTDNPNKCDSKLNYNNYMSPKMIYRQKNFPNNQIKNIENKQKKKVKMNKNNKINSTDTKSLIESKNISYKNMKNSKKKQETIYNDNDNILKEIGFNEDYYYTTMDFSNLDFVVSNNSNLQNANKKHVKFDLTQNVSFIYNKNDYICDCKIYIKNKNTRIKNLRKNSKPIIKKFNKEDIKINKKYILNERLKEKEIVTDFFKIFSDGDFWS